MNKNVIELAEELIAKADYNQAQQLLLDEIITNTDNHYFYFLIGYTYFVTKDFGNSLKFFSKSLSIHEDADDAKLFIAVIHLHNYNITLSMKYWLELIEKNKNKYAMRAIKLVKNAEDKDLTKMFSDPFKYHIVPVFNKKRKKRILHLGLPLVLLAFSLAFIVITLINYRSDLRQRKEILDKREAQLIQVISQDIDLLDQSNTTTHYPIFLNMTGTEIEQTYQKLSDAFLAFNDIAVRKFANKIVYSNASLEKKIKTEYIVQLLPEPDYAQALPWPTIEEILQEPLLYRGMPSKFKGTTTNINVTSEKGKGEFLVGYYGDDAQLTTVIPIVFSSNFELQNGDELELYLQIEPENRDDPDSIVFVVRSFRYLLRK